MELSQTCIFFPFRDEGVHWGIQNGLFLSRSTIIYFKHNNMESLRDTLEKVTRDNKRAKKLRRYIVVEAVYQVIYIQYGNFFSKTAHFRCMLTSPSLVTLPFLAYKYVVSEMQTSSYSVRDKNSSFFLCT